MKAIKWFDKRLAWIVAVMVVVMVIGGFAIQTTVKPTWYSDAAVVAGGGIAAEDSNVVIEQPDVVIPCDAMERITCWTTIVNPDGNGKVILEILQNDQPIRTSTVEAAQIGNNDMTVFNFAPIENGKGQTVVLRIHSEGMEGSGLYFYYGNVYDTGKAQVADTSGIKATVNGESMDGKICFTMQGNNYAASYGWYWPVCGGIVVVLIAAYIQLRREQAGKKRWPVLKKCHDFYDYRFLIKQLVIRDFKIKYKRSVLGVLWSFINPLLTMLVQYFVFSQVFKNTVNNYPVYLMAGGVLFSYMQECVDLGMNSITGNRDLINKVHIPLEIFPISRVLSSLINLAVSLLPLIIMMIATGAPFTMALIFVPFVILALAMFCVGMSMLFSAAMVFFRDMQFLWSVFSMFWMYLTPIFYSEEIIASQFLTAYRMNPMYQFLTFFRSIILEGVVPEAGLFLGCALSAVIACVLGSWAFHANKKKFVLYL